MKTMSAPAIRDEWDFDATMNAIILYDDFELATKANAILGHAMRHTDETAQWNVKPLRVNLLTLTDLASAALDDAADAHLVVLALREAEPLHASLVDWLDQWAAHRQVADVALALFGGRSGVEQLAPATPELAHFAERNGLSFLFDESGPVKNESEVYARSLHERAVTQTSTMLHLLEQAPHDLYRGWGINE